MALYVNVNNIIYFDRLGVERIPPKEVEKFKETKIQSQIFIEYKHMIRWYVDTFVLDLLVLC